MRIVAELVAGPFEGLRIPLDKPTGDIRIATTPLPGPLPAGEVEAVYRRGVEPLEQDDEVTVWPYLFAE